MHYEKHIVKRKVQYMKRDSLLVTVLLLVGVFFFISPAFAIMKALSTEELTKMSDRVVIGEVEDVEAQWSKDGKTIISSASIAVKKVVKGKVDHARIVVEYEGGELGDIGLRVSDVAPLKKGDHVLLFLKTAQSKKDGIVNTIVGKAQGKYTIDNSGIASKDGFSLADGEKVEDTTIPFDKLIKKIMEVNNE